MKKGIIVEASTSRSLCLVIMRVQSPILHLPLINKHYQKTAAQSTPLHHLIAIRMHRPPNRPSRHRRVRILPIHPIRMMSMSIHATHRTNTMMMSIHAINAIVMMSHLAMSNTRSNTGSSNASSTPGNALASPPRAPCECRSKQIPIAGHVRKRHAAVQGDVVESPVPDGRVRHAVSRKGHGRADDGAGHHVVPVVELVNSERTADEHRAEDGHVDDDELPHGRVVVGKDLELGVEVQVQKDKARKGGRRMAAGERLQAVVNLVWVAGADVARVVDLREAAPVQALVGDAADVRLAHVEEVRAKAANEPFAEDLEDGGGDERVQETEDAVVDVPEGADADLHHQDDRNGYDGGEERGQPDGDNLFAEGVAKLGPDNLAIRKGNGERSSRCRLGFVDLSKTVSYIL